MRTAVFEDEARSSREISQRPTCENLVGPGEGSDPGRDVYGDAADVVAADFDLACVYPGAQPQPDRREVSAELNSEAGGSGGTVEASEHAVTGALDQAASMSRCQAPRGIVVTVEQTPPLRIAEAGGQVS